MKLNEYNEMMAYMLRPATRQKFANGGIAGELKEFVEKFKNKNGRIPTQNEIVKGTGRAAKTIKTYLVEGVDYAKPLTKLEAAKLGGKKSTGITEVSDDLVKQFKDLKFTHISPSVSTAPSTGSKSFRVRFTGPIANDFKDIAMPATEENLQKITNQIDDIVTGNLYKNKAKKFKTEEQFRKLRRLKDAMYRKKDPYGIYEKLRKYKSKIFPGDASKDIQIQHGQPKFSTQTLSRFGFIPKDVNVSPEVEMVERIRNEKLATIQKRLKNTNLSIGQKADLIEEFNDTMKGLRGQLKGTPAQGLVNFELLDIDQDGNVTKLKDTGFDPKRGLVESDEDLSKITKERADELIKLGKQKIDSEAVRLNLIPADKISTPEKTKTREMFEQANKRLSDGPTLGMNLGLGKALGSVLKYVPTPAATVGLSAGFGIDPESSLDRTILGTELAAAPALVKQSSRIASNPLLRRVLNLGLSPQMAMRAARVASPIGIASLIGEAGYNLGKQALSEQDRIDAMSPEEREEFLAEQESLLDFSA